MPRRQKIPDDQQRLDDALSDTFPASDPVSFLQPGLADNDARTGDARSPDAGSDGTGATARTVRRAATARPRQRRP
jgi:hypothetical protein